MRLTPELFEEITGYNESALQGARQEKRAAARLPLAFRTTARALTPQGLGPPVAVQVREISATGIGMLHPASVQLGPEFAVLLRGAGGRSISLCYTSVHRQGINKTLARTGARFVRVISEVESVPRAERAAKPASPTKPASQQEAEIDRIRRALFS